MSPEHASPHSWTVQRSILSVLKPMRRSVYAWLAGCCFTLILGTGALQAQPMLAEEVIACSYVRVDGCLDARLLVERDLEAPVVQQPDSSQTASKEGPVPHGPKLAWRNVQTGDGFTVGLGFGPKERLPRQFIDLKALLSTKLYWAGVVTVGYEVGPSLMTYGFGRYRHMPEEDFYGLGKDTELEGRTTYRINEASGGALAAWTVAPRSLAGGYSYYEQSWYGPGKDEDYPITAEVFSADTVPALGQDTRYAVAGVFFELDRRDKIDSDMLPERFLPTDQLRGLSFNTRRGVYAMIRAEHHAVLDGQDYNFSLLEARVQQYLPIVGDVHSLAFEQRAVLTSTGDSQEVPFYLMPTIGGSKTLRGFDSFRFRDRNMVVFNAEYRWQVIDPLDLVIFGDAGEVFQTLDAFNLSDLETSYGIGARLRTFIKLPIVPYDVTYLKVRLARSREEIRYGIGLSAFM